MSLRDDGSGPDGHAETQGKSLNCYTHHGDHHSEQELVDNTEINQVFCVRQSVSSNSEELQSRLGHLDRLDSTGSVSVCQMRTVQQGEGRSSDLLATKTQGDDEGLVSFVRAVHLKYQPSDEEATDDIVIIHTSGNIKATSSGTLNLPKRVSMSGQEISVAGDATCIEKMCASVTELDLMENNIASWDEVFNIIVCIPHLTFLNLTSNRLNSDLGPLTSVRSRPLPCLTHLVLNNTGISWDTLACLLVIFPRLVELHLGLNKYHNFGLTSTFSNETSLETRNEKSSHRVRAGKEELTYSDSSAAATTAEDNSCVPEYNIATKALSQCSHEDKHPDHSNSSSLPLPLPASCENVSPGPSVSAAVTTSSPPPPACCYLSLQRLFFVNNCITDWGEISKLGQFFPNMEYLLLSETDISDLGNPGDIPQCFPHLKSLGLGRTQLSSWVEVEKLAHFPMLTDVRLSGIPFLETFSKDRRFQHTVALLPNISTLNGSKVTESEREDAERAFLRRFMDADTKPSRYYELEEKYGRLDPLAQVELKPQRTVKIKVRVEDAQQQPVKQEEMDIELDQTVRALRKLLSLMAGRPAGKLSLFYMDNQIEAQGLDRLIYLDRRLFSYNMTDGDEIIVAYKD